MDGTKFDALARKVSGEASRRTAVKALVGGLVGIGVARAAVAEAAVEPAGCRVQRCRKLNPDSDKRCRQGRDCCKGLDCNNRGRCVFKQDSGGAGDFCFNDRDCKRGFFCRKNQCIPNDCA